MRRVAAVVAAALVAVLAAFAYFALIGPGRAPIAPEDVVRGVGVKFELSSPAFAYGGDIPRKYSKEGADLSPPLSWRGVPGAACYVLIVYDPDAPGGIFYHWLLYNMPANLTSLPEGVPKAAETPYGMQGVNSYGEIGYGGPYPPPGERHRYVFLLLALNARLPLGPGASAEEVLRACAGHVIAYAMLLGYYSR